MPMESVIKAALNDETVQRKVIQLLNKGNSLDTIIDLAPSDFHHRLLFVSKLLRLSNNGFDTVQAIVSDARALDVSSVAYYYYLQVPDLPDEQIAEWRRQLYQLEPTAVLRALVDFDVLFMDAYLKPLVSGVLQHVVSKKRDITKQAFRDIVQGYSFSEDTPAKKQDEALGSVKAIQRLQALTSEPLVLVRLWNLLRPQQRSAQYIAGLNETDFVKSFVAGKGPVLNNALEDVAQRIYSNAVLIRMRNEQIWASLLRSRTQLRLPALESKSKDEYFDDGTVSYVNIFHEMESVEFDHAESVLSPAAYFVDLLKTLDEVPVNEAGDLTLLDCLSWRRPDLKDLELSTTNTNVLIPYIDLVNEILESFIANSKGALPDESIPVIAYNMKEKDTSKDCENQPRHIDSDVYQKFIQPKFFPLTSFPYNHAVDTLRTFLDSVGCDLANLRDTLQSKFRLVSAKELLRAESRQDVLDAAAFTVRRAIMAEKLSIQEEDLIAITGEGFMSLARFRQLRSSTALATEEDFKKDRQYPSVATLWGYANPAADGIAPLDQMLDTTNELGLTFVKAQLLPRSGLSFDDLTKMLKTEYLGGQLILAPSNGSSQFSTKLDDLRLCASTLVSEDGKLTEALCGNYQAFIRLRKCLGWDIDLLDAALCCLNQGRTQSQRYVITPETICELAAIKELSMLIDQDIESLLPWWGSIYTNGPRSLYARLFLQHAMPETGKFTADRDSRFLSDKSPVSMSTSSIVLTTALHISTEELATLNNICGLGSDPALTLSNVSLLYRVLSFCRVTDTPFQSYRSFCDIFAAESDDVFGSPQTTLAALKNWKSLTETGWTLPQLADCIATTSARKALPLGDYEVQPIKESILQSTTKYREQALRAIHAITNSFGAISTTWPTVDYATPEIIQKVMVALWGKDKAALELSTFNKECESLSAGDLEDKRVAKHNEVVDALRLHLLRQSIFDTINADFSDMSASMIQLIMSDVAQVSWEGQTITPMKMLQNIVQTVLASPEKKADGSKTSGKIVASAEQVDAGNPGAKETGTANTALPDKPQIDGFFSPTATGKYWFSLKSAGDGKSTAVDVTTRLLIDNTPIVIDKTPLAAVRLLSGQTYHFKFYGAAEDLLWTSDPQLKTDAPFPTAKIIDIVAVQGVQAAYKAIARIASTVSLEQLNLEELQFFAGILGSKVIDLDPMFLQELLKLDMYRKTRDALSKKKNVSAPLLDFFKWAARPDKTAWQLVEEIIKVTGWTDYLVREVLTAKYPNISPEEKASLLSDVEEFAALSAIMEALPNFTALGWSAEEAFKIATPVITTADMFDMAKKTRERLQVKMDKAGQSTGLSTPTLTNAYDRLRANQRSSLLQYITHNEVLKKTARIVDSDSLFDYLLIDVNMGPTLQTSRIKQAISTIQLFVQRCFQGLEFVPGVSEKTKVKVAADLKSKWIYMEKYTIWEANRKIFLYPENWIEPNLRDNKSEQFKAFESTILQNNISFEAITEAVRAYIFEVNSVANLDVQAYLWERKAEGCGRFHFFARTRTIPHQFYYRYMDIEKVGDRLTYWHPWSKLDLGTLPQSMDKDNTMPKANGNYLIPTVVQGRLFLFVPEIMLKTKDIKQDDGAPKQSVAKMAEKTPDQLNTRVKYWEVKMSWTELRGDKWTPKVYSPDVLEVVEEKPEDFQPRTLQIPPRSDQKTIVAQAIKIVAETSGQQPPRPGKEIPRLEHFRFGVRAREANSTASVGALGASGGFDTCKASFSNGVEDFLIIDVESCKEQAAGQPTTATLIGQFEMRNSQLYLRQTSSNSGSADPSTTTVPTKYGRLQWKNSGLPSYDLSRTTEVVETVDGKQIKKTVVSHREPMLFDPATTTSDRVLTWTMSFDATQYSRPLGLVVDVASMTAGARTYFAMPPEKEPNPDQKSSVFNENARFTLLDHPNASELTQCAAKNADLETILQRVTLKQTSKDATLLFGNFRGDIFHEMFSPNSIYNWELSVHIVMLLMERFLSTQQFDMAIRMARMVFDPTINGSSPRDCWLFPPFMKDGLSLKSTRDLLEDMKPKTDAEGNKHLSYDEIQVAEWQANPFNAHSIARGRPMTYMKRIVLKYIETLVAAGDQYFRQASLEAIPLALQRYIEASHLFGPGMRQMKPLGKRPTKTYAQIMGKTNLFSNASVDLELDLPFSCVRNAPDTVAAPPDDARQGLMGFVPSTYFGVPANPKLLELRSLIDDRLFKIRNCQDINGNPLKLPLFDPPLDPGMLVQAQAAGGNNSLSLLLNDLDSPMPNCRFTLLLQKALDMVSELRSMADFFLSAKEKQDAESLCMLKSKQELTIQSMMCQVKALQREEAVKSVEALQDLRKSHVSRLRYYLGLLGESASLVPGEKEDWDDLEQQIDKPSKDDDLRISSNERLEMEKANSAAALAFKASILDTTAAALIALPYFTTTVQPFGLGVMMKFDTENISKGIKGSSGVLKLLSEYQSNEGARAGRKQQFIRQLQERRLSANMAGRDIKNVDRQIATQRARIAICDAEITLQAEQLSQAQQTTDWYRSKYTNEQLYSWFESRSRTLLYETYIMAIDLARKAEKVFQFEHAPGRQTLFLSPQGYWDSGHDGLLAAQNIQLALRRMEAAFLDRTSPDFEICKVISLRQLDPMALFDLQRNGVAQFSLPEVMFDMDFPGHYLRRIKSVAVSVPCITGPYTSLNCTLSLLQHKYRVSPAIPGGAYAEKPGSGDERFRTDRIPISSIAVGDRSLDSGRFDMSFGGERFLPFENAGVLSDWKIELPKFRQFDYATISDVVLTLRYTSRQGGGRLKELAQGSVDDFIAKASSTAASSVSQPCAWIDLKNEYYSEFLALTKPDSGVSTVILKGMADKLPFWARGQTATAQSIQLYIQTNDQKEIFSGDFNITKAGLELKNKKLFSAGWTVVSLADTKQDVGDWPLRVTNLPKSGPGSEIVRIVLFFQYKVKTAPGS